MNHTLTTPVVEPANSRITAVWLGVFAVLFLALMIVLAYATSQSGAVELQTVPGQTLLFIDLTNNNL